MTATTTLKLPERLKSRIARLAKETKRSAHSLMIEALERQVAREERMREFVREALVSDAAVEEGAAVYRPRTCTLGWTGWREIQRPHGPSRGAGSLFTKRACHPRTRVRFSG